MKKVLVTGGCGFVGRHLIQKLLTRKEYVIYCVDKIVPGTGAIHPQKGWPFINPFDFSNFNFYQQDCRDFFNKCLDTEFDYVFHLAAIVGGRLTIENNPLAVAEDLSIDSEFFAWSAISKPKKIVYFSSSAVYPVKLQSKEFYSLLKEDMVDFDNNNDIGIPDMTYGWAKLTGEYLASLAHKKHGLNIVIYRPFSGYGIDQDDSYPFPSILKRVLKERGSSVIKVWGSGRQMRDFIHIDDCIDGVLITMDKISNAKAINLSTGIYTSFIDFVKIAVDICGFKCEITGITDKPEGVFARAGDTKKQKELGFTYTIELKEGIRSALEYYSKNMEI